MRFTTLFCFVLCYLANTRAATLDIAECGKASKASARPLRSVGNQQVGSHPWHVGLFRPELTNSSYYLICGGTIIHPKFIVTAAHCLGDEVNKGDYRIVAGKINRLWDKHEDSQQTVKMTDIVIPENFNGRRSNYAGDIALIKVDPPFSSDSAVSPVCIDQNNNQVENNKLGSMVGWTLPWGKFNSDILQETDGNIISGEECAKKKIDNIDKFKSYITSDKFCTYNKDGDDRSLMSGGGVFYQDNGKVYLHGIISVGTRNQNYIVGHTSIPYHHDWIAKNMKERL